MAEKKLFDGRRLFGSDVFKNRARFIFRLPVISVNLFFRMCYRYFPDAAPLSLPSLSRSICSSITEQQKASSTSCDAVHQDSPTSGIYSN